MSEWPSPAIAEDPGRHGREALTPEAIEGVLADFRSWLAELGVAHRDEPVCPPVEKVDLHTLVGQFAALRHEVNLHTKTSRAQLEQNAEALRLLEETSEQLRAADAVPVEDEGDSGEDAVRPLLKTLVDVADALGLADREIQKVRDALEEPLDRLAALPEAAPEPASPPASAASFWSRWRSPAPATASSAAAGPGLALDAAREAAGRARRLMDSILAGYAMSLQRLERVLAEHGLEDMACAGRPFDPEEMEVVEVVTGTGLPAGQVIDEARRGYRWRGRVFRYALVRVAK